MSCQVGLIWDIHSCCWGTWDDGTYKLLEVWPLHNFSLNFPFLNISCTVAYAYKLYPMGIRSPQSSIWQILSPSLVSGTAVFGTQFCVTLHIWDVVCLLWQNDLNDCKLVCHFEDPFRTSISLIFLVILVGFNDDDVVFPAIPIFCVFFFFTVALLKQIVGRCILTSWWLKINNILEF